MDRVKMRLIAVHKDDSQWMKIHFCSLLQRAAEIDSASADGWLGLSDIAELWFPVPLGTDLFQVVEEILVSHKAAHHLVQLNEISKVRAIDAMCTDWEAIYCPSVDG